MSSCADAAITTESVREEYNRFVGRKISGILLFIALIVVLVGIAASVGSADLTISESYSAILERFFPDHFHTDRIAYKVVWVARMPRILMGIIAGMGLAIAGCVMQGILRNPLASPFTLGISAGAGFGAALAITLGAGILAGKYLIIGNAFFFALIPTLVILGLARYRQATPEMMILAGIAMLYIFNAATILVECFADPGAVKAAVFWTIGSLGKASWDNLLPASMVLACCIPLLMWKSWDLNVMGAGDETAKSLGVNVERTRVSVLTIASLLTAAIVCFVGTIGFIGLVAPHLCRMVIGGDNRFLIPASGLCGASLLLGADTVARTIIAPATLPVGVITAFMGGPLFMYLIIKRRREYW